MVPCAGIVKGSTIVNTASGLPIVRLQPSAAGWRDPCHYLLARHHPPIARAYRSRDRSGADRLKYPTAGSAFHGGIVRATTRFFAALRVRSGILIRHQRHRREHRRPVAFDAVRIENRRHVLVNVGASAWTPTRRRSPTITHLRPRLFHAEPPTSDRANQGMPGIVARLRLGFCTKVGRLFGRLQPDYAAFIGLWTDLRRSGYAVSPAALQMGLRMVLVGEWFRRSRLVQYVARQSNCWEKRHCSEKSRRWRSPVTNPLPRPVALGTGFVAKVQTPCCPSGARRQSAAPDSLQELYDGFTTTSI